MPVTGLDPEKCRARSRLAARRDGVDAAPVRLLAGAGTGRLPVTAAQALERINALVPGSVLTADDVFLHTMEAANSNFIPDRFLFLDDSTLRNIARDGEAGVAFMNSHRSGGLSHPSELPFGRTFAGRYEQEGREARALLGVYMLRQNQDGEPYRPNGNSGPSTADLHAGIESGTIFDVSVGLYGGTPTCDVCGEDLNGLKPGWHAGDFPEYLCPHAPGTTLEMTEAEQAAQRARGVPDGKCSYTLVGARLGEVSAVFDGAVPGAGFRKALSLCAGMGAETLAQARQSYLPLCRKHDFQRGDRPPLPDLASALQLLWGGDDPEPAPAAGSFETQLEHALASVQGCITRAEAVHAARAVEGRTVSAARRADLESLQAELSRLLVLTASPAAQQRRLRIHALRTRAAAIAAGDRP